MKILVFDNYDSFTYNLVYLIRTLGYGEQMDIYRNDKITLEEVDAYDKILISPGPGLPEEAGILHPLLKKYAPEKSILGVCLGHQGIAEVFGAKLFNMPMVKHGISSTIKVTQPDDYMFEGVPHEFEGCHYHSWAVVPETLPNELAVTATDNDGNIMALTHTKYDVKGLQFHPESIMTPCGKQIISNWLKH